jgi:hypothetical protein
VRYWPKSVGATISNWRVEWRLQREALKISREIYPTLWENVRRKIANTSEKELSAYAELRAAQLSQERIDSLMQAEMSLSGAFAARLLVKSAGRATTLVLAEVTRARRTAA